MTIQKVSPQSLSVNSMQLPLSTHMLIYGVCGPIKTVTLNVAPHPPSPHSSESGGGEVVRGGDALWFQDGLGPVWHTLYTV